MRTVVPERSIYNTGHDIRGTYLSSQRFTNFLMRLLLPLLILKFASFTIARIVNVTIDDTYGDELTGAMPDYGSDCTHGFPPCDPDCGPGCSRDCEHGPLLDPDAYHTCMDGGFGSRILFDFEGYVIVKLHCWLPLGSSNNPKVGDILVPSCKCGCRNVCRHCNRWDCSDQLFLGGPRGRLCLVVVQRLPILEDRSLGRKAQCHNRVLPYSLWFCKLQVRIDISESIWVAKSWGWKHWNTRYARYVFVDVGQHSCQCVKHVVVACSEHIIKAQSSWTDRWGHYRRFCPSYRALCDCAVGTPSPR